MMEKPSPRLTTTTTTSTGTIIIPRPKSVFTKRDVARLDDSYQSWMQEYHRQHQFQRNQQILKAPSKQHPGTSTNKNTKSLGSSPSNSLSKKSKGSNLFLNFNSLKINPLENNINALKKGGLVDGKTAQQMESLEGYRIYKGPGNVTLGISRQNTTTGVNHAAQDVNNGAVITPYTPLILPDRFILAPGKPQALDSKSAVRISSQQAPKQMTTPFHIQLHPHRRPRPHSASIDFSSHHSSSIKDRNGNRVNENGKNTRTHYKAPSVTTIQLHSSEAIALTPRSLPTTKTTTATTDDNNNIIDTKPEHQNGQPKSILKNHKDSTTPSPHAFQIGIANYSKTLPTSHPKPKHDFSYHELVITSGGKNLNNHSSPPGTLSRHSPLNSPQRSPALQRAESKRPKSASATTSRFELLDRSGSTRRKSVTFNSFVSFSSDSKVSTIRALPVDV